MRSGIIDAVPRLGLTMRASAWRACCCAVGAVLLAAAGAAPAAAEHHEDNPRVGGEGLYDSGLAVDADAGPLPSAAAESFVVADLDTGEIIAAQNAHEQHPPASTLKMLTALTVLPRIDLDTIYTATAEDVLVEGSKVGIVAGSSYTARQLFEGMFLISGNDAANAVANLNGSLDGTVAQMQAEAGRIQAYDTVVRNANGLDADGQVSSAYDLALIARAGLADPDFAEFAALSNSTFPMSGTSEPTTRPTFEIWNQNSLVTGAYEGGIGVKSGFTTNAGRTFAAAAERDGQRYLVTLMGIAGNTYAAGADYLDWAFANAADLEPVGMLVAPKFDVAPSDGAALVGSDEGIAAAVSVSSEQAGRAPVVLAGITLAAGVTVWWLVRAPYRRALRRRTAAPVRDVRVVDLRDDVRV